MASDDELPTRVETLEVKVAFQEHLLGELDDVLRSLRDELDQVRGELSSMHEEMKQLSPAPENSKPPHY